MTATADAVHADPTRAFRDVPLAAPWTRRRVQLAAIALAFIIGAIWGLRRVDMSLFALIDGWPDTWNLIQRMWPPFIPADDRTQILNLLVDTFFMAFLGTFIGVVLSIPLGLLASRNVSHNSIVRGTSRAIIAFARAVPSLVLALVFVRVFGIGPIAGILALGIHSIGFCGKLFSAAADNIELGPRDGVASTGASRGQELLTGVWSQMIPSVIATSLYRVEINFREGSLIGLVGGGGIGLAIRGYQGSLRYQELLGVTLVVIVAVIAMELLSQAARKTILGDSDPFGKRTGAIGTRFSLTGLLARALRRRTRNRTVVDDPPERAARHANEAGDVPLSPPWNKERIKLAALSGGVVVCTILSFVLPDIAVGRFFTSLIDIPSTLLRLVPSNFDFWTSQIRSDLVETIAMGLAATFMAMLAALPLSFLAASNVAPSRLVFRVTRFVMILVRATPELVLAVLFVAALGLGPRTGTLALAVGIFGFSTRLFADTIEEARSGPREGVVSTGATRLQDTASGVAPQVWPALVSQGLYIFDVSLRASTVLGIVGAGGIGFLLSNSMRTLNFEVTGGIILCIFVIVGAIEVVSNWVDRQIT
ncbi:phosphonate ABC transporter, permease protein PhnE [Ilumatobacter sp.]|uniref:phosphonate ABC transporter, permease protein PhnE n=1 Tax=Ilumatobacter sp. TaxID=1967498 RepID=UPI0037534A74